MLTLRTDEKKELANAYRTLMDMPAWKNLESYIHTQKNLSLEKEDNKTASDLTLGFVCQERGIRKGLQMLLDYASRCREGF